MRYTVHHYLPVLVTVKSVEAPSMQAAVDQSVATAMQFAEQHFNAEVADGAVSQSQFAEDVLGALVDVEGDDEYLQTTYIGSEEARSFLPTDEA